MNIITGYRGEAHITAQQDRDVNIGIFGEETHIADIGSKMAATVISANEVRIADGLLVAQGCTAEIARGTTESLTISNGSQGLSRIDLIVARYTKNAGTGVESMGLVVINGTPAASNPAVPTHTAGDIAAGDTVADFPLYKVNIDGISITSVERLVDIISISGNIDEINSVLDEIRADMGGVKAKAVIRQDVTLPTGGGSTSQTVVSFEDYLPTNAHLVGVDVTMGDFHFPYMRDGRPATWVSKLWERAIRIDNTTSAWPAGEQYTMYAVLFYTEVTP